MDRFNQYVNNKFAETQKIQHDWALTTLPVGSSLLLVFVVLYTECVKKKYTPSEFLITQPKINIFISNFWGL